MGASSPTPGVRGSHSLPGFSGCLLISDVPIAVPIRTPSHPPHARAPIPARRLHTPAQLRVAAPALLSDLGYAGQRNNLLTGFFGRERWGRGFRVAANPPFSSLGPPPPGARSLFAEAVVGAGSESRGLWCPPPRATFPGG